MKREFKLIGCYDDERWLIYQVKASQFVMVNVEQGTCQVEPNWISPLKWADYFMFIEISVYDEKAREIIDDNIEYVDKMLDELDHTKPNRKIIRWMANARKHAKPNQPLYW